MTDFATDPSAIVTPMSPTEMASGLICNNVTLGRLNFLFQQALAGVGDPDIHVTAWQSYDPVTNIGKLLLSDGSTVDVNLTDLIADVFDDILSIADDTTVTSATALPASVFNQTIYLDDGPANYTVNLPFAGAADAGKAVKLIAARDLTKVAMIQTGGGGSFIDSQAGYEMLAGETATVRWTGTEWQIVDERRIPIVAQLLRTADLPLTTGDYADVLYPLAGTQMMAFDISDIWRTPVAGAFTAPRAGTYTVTVRNWLDYWGGSGFIDIGIYNSPVALGTSAAPNQEQFKRLYIAAATGNFNSLDATFHIAMGKGSTVFVNVKPFAGLTTPHLAALRQTVTFVEHNR